MVGAIAATAMTASVAYFLATGLNLVREPKVDTNMEMVIIAPPEPPPPVQEPEPPKVDVPPSPAPPPELVAPDIPFEIEVPPVITAPVAEATPVPDPAPVTPAPPSGANRSAPKLRAGEKPDYPSASVRAGEQGTTHLEVCVNNGGRVTSVSVAGTSGSPRLDDAAAKWIRNERFTPGMIDGVAQSMCGHDVYYEWNLRDARS
jgi:protein TonB